MGKKKILRFSFLVIGFPHRINISTHKYQSRVAGHRHEEGTESQGQKLKIKPGLRPKPKKAYPTLECGGKIRWGILNYAQD